MTEAQRAAIAAIESQQPQKHNTVWMAGEQLKEIARSEPGSAELLAKDLAGKGMTIAAAEKDAKAAAKQAKAELKALRDNPVIPAEVLEKLRAEETQRAAETAQQETARRVAEAEKAAQESARRAEQAERQLAAADPEVATFKAWFRAVQDDFARMQETHAQVTDPEKADKLRAAVRALLERERTVWG